MLGHAQHRRSAHLNQRLHERHVRHGHDLHRHALHPLLAQHRRLFAVVGNHDELLGGVGHDLLLQLARAAAFDAVELRVHLVCAVDRHVDHRVLVQARERELVLRNELQTRPSGGQRRMSGERRPLVRLPTYSKHLLGLERSRDALDAQLTVAHELAEALGCVYDGGSAAHADHVAVAHVLVHRLTRGLCACVSDM